MDLHDLDREIREGLEVCRTAKVEGRPDEVMGSLEAIQALITLYLDGPATAKEEPES